MAGPAQDGGRPLELSLSRQFKKGDIQGENTMPSRNSSLLSNLPAWQPIPQTHTSGRPPLNNPLHSSQLPLRVEVEPMYPHAFVTFGAGMRQKEIDTFTAEHKLEACYLTGHGDGIPYHVPL